MRYPTLKANSVIGVTAPSSGVREEIHSLIHDAEKRLIERGFTLKIGSTTWTQEKAKSAHSVVRADELLKLMKETDMLIPPWGGELLIEILDKINWDELPVKWILGFSDISTLLLAVTLKRGIATLHGQCLVEMRGEYQDSTSAMWEKIAMTKVGESVTQQSSNLYQKEWDFNNPTPCVFNLTEKTEWKIVNRDKVKISGRLLGGCIDTIRQLIGTPYGDVQSFRKNHTNGEPVIWYLENCELVAADVRRSVIQMKLAGWFENCSGIMFGRSSGGEPTQDYTELDIYQDLAEELGIPIIHDIDCGHVPPQIIFVNGAIAEIEVTRGKGVVVQKFI